MEYHEAANIFPLDEDNVQSLADDIKANGQLRKIELLDGKIIDGRNRWLACQLAGVKPSTITVSPADPVAYVLSLNLHRRHLTPSQKSMVAARARDMYDAAAKGRLKTKGGHSGPVNLPGAKSDARDAAGKATGVSGKSVDFATKVLKHGTPELIKAVDEGRMAVSTAAVHATDPPEEQREILENGHHNRKYKPNPHGGHEREERIDETEAAPGQKRGVGIERAHEAIACLKKIPKRDGLRKRGFQIVLDWMKHNK
jgi:hypothetical protein